MALSLMLAACGTESPSQSTTGNSTGSSASVSAQAELSTTPPALGSATEVAPRETLTLSDAQELAARLEAAAATSATLQPDGGTGGTSDGDSTSDIATPADVNIPASTTQPEAAPAIAAALPDTPPNPLAVVEEAPDPAPVESVAENDTGPDSDSDADAASDLGAEGSTAAENEPATTQPPTTTDSDSALDSTNDSDSNTPSDSGVEADSGSDAATDTGTASNGSADNEGDTATNAGGDDSTLNMPVERQTRFESRNTAGFTGELLDNETVRVRWPADAGARGYNVYRDADYHTTVYTNEYIDDGIHDRSYYYEIQAFDFDEKFTTIAIGLTVTVSGLGRLDPDAPAKNADLLSGYDLVFADEFDTGALDPTKWNTAFLWGPDVTINSEEQYYVDILRQPDFGFDPFTFEDGVMSINSIPTPTELRSKARNQPYLSGLITSYDAFKFTYGYAEVRARMPYGKGLWPAFWLLNAYYVDDEPEIDIVEFIGDNQDTAYHTYHYYDANGELRSTKSQPTTGTDWTADFHTYGVDWRPGLLVYYIDGIEVHRFSDPKVSRQDMYIIANTALGGWWAGSPDETTMFPRRFELDYIRVYRKTTAYSDPPFSDGASSDIDLATQVPGASPSHRPPRELFPEAYLSRP